MKTKQLIACMCMLLLSVSMTFTTSAAEKKGKEKEKIVFAVKMDCRSCEAKINKNIAFEKGVTDLKVDFDNQTVEITYRKDKTSPEQLAGAMKKLGFDTTVVGDEPGQKKDA